LPVRLLLVEDDTMIGEVVLDLLRSEHFAVDWVRDGDMADTAVRSQRYDLVLLDLGLPRRDGLDVLRALRACKDSTPVLIVTARNAVADRIAAWMPAPTTTYSNPTTCMNCWRASAPWYAAAAAAPNRYSKSTVCA